jgi:ribulose-phosphate 3-epimerase
MVEIIPSINVPTFEEVQERIAKVEPYVSWCHLDVTDGVFSKHLTWHDPADLPRLETKLDAEVHLMVEKPEEIISQWLVRPIKRVIVHLEALHDPDLVIEKCHDAGIQIGFAIRTDTAVSLLDAWLTKVDMIVLLRVQPGASGQQMQSEMLGEIAHIRNACPGCTIEIDGGVTVDNAKRAVDAGANILVAGNYVFQAANVQEAIEKLKNA